MSWKIAKLTPMVSSDSLTNSCSGEGCTVHLDDIPTERVIINIEKEFDARGESGKRCDQMLFYGNKNTFLAVPIELKGRGKGDESQVLEQLKSGLEFAATLVSDLKEAVYVPIVFTKSGIKSRNPRQQNRELNMISRFC